MSGYTYLAQPIDLASGPMLDADAVAQYYRKPVYSPQQAWAVGPCEPTPILQRVNLEVLSRASHLVVGVDTAVFSVGTVVELWEAASIEVPQIELLVKSAPARVQLQRSWTLAYIRGHFDIELPVNYYPDLLTVQK